MRIKTYIINDLILLLLVLYSFVFGGFLQFFIGFSPTILSFLISMVLFLFIIIKRKHSFNRNNLWFILITVLMMAYTFVVSLINMQGIIKPSIYSLFFIIPLMIYSLFNNRKGMQLYSISQLKRALLFVAVFQLPILLIQLYGYEFFMQFNNSGQTMRDVDFQFGTFFLKNDHALGFFLIANILYVWSYPVLKNSWQKIMVTIILLINLLLTNSKVGVLFGALALFYIFVNNRKYLLAFFLRLKYLLLFLILTCCLALVYFEFNFYLDLKAKYNYELSLKWYELGVAAREHIVVVILKEGLLFFGNGAYSYFDITRGEFNNMFRHFSQYIWFYYDLGLVGLSLIMVFFYRMHKLFKQNQSSYSNFMILGVVLYSYFTIVTFDISFVLIYFLYKYSDDKKSNIHSLS